MGAAGLVLLPLDLSGVSACCPPAAIDRSLQMISLHVAEMAWRTLYWSTFVLAWVLLPVVYEYHLAGDFSVGSKLCTAVLANCRIYLLYGLLIGSFVSWCTAHL